MDMVSLARFSHVGGIPIDTWLDNETLEQLVHHTRFGGGEIVTLLKKGSAYYAPASSIESMMEANPAGRKTGNAGIRSRKW